MQTRKRRHDSDDHRSAESAKPTSTQKKCSCDDVKQSVRCMADELLTKCILRETERAEKELKSNECNVKEQSVRCLVDEVLTKCLVREAERAEEQLKRAVEVHHECINSITNDVLERMEKARWSFVGEYLSEKATQRKLRQELQEADALRSRDYEARGERSGCWEDVLPSDVQKRFGEKHLPKRINIESKNIFVNSSKEHGSCSKKTSQYKDNYHNFREGDFINNSFTQENRRPLKQDTNYSFNKFSSNYDELRENSNEIKSSQKNFQNYSPKRLLDDYPCQVTHSDIPIVEGNNDFFHTLVLRGRGDNIFPNQCYKHQDRKKHTIFTEGSNYHTSLSDQFNEHTHHDRIPAYHLQYCDAGDGCFKHRNDLCYDHSGRKIQGCRMCANHCRCSDNPRHNYSDFIPACRREKKFFCECRADCKSTASKNAGGCGNGRISSCRRARKDSERCLVALINARDALVEEMSAAPAGDRCSAADNERLDAIAALNGQIRNFLCSERGHRRFEDEAQTVM